MAAAERWAESICKNSPMSIRASKQAIQKGLEVSLEQAMAEQRDFPAVKAMAASQDYIEGPKAFSEKRPRRSGWGNSARVPDAVAARNERVHARLRHAMAPQSRDPCRHRWTPEQQRTTPQGRRAALHPGNAVE